jgi:hypothetical protein
MARIGKLAIDIARQVLVRELCANIAHHADDVICRPGCKPLPFATDNRYIL